MALLAGSAGGVAGFVVARHEASATQQSSAERVEAVAKNALPSVVTIQISSSSGRMVGTGSGFVLRSDGYIVTNNHVASAGGDGERLTVEFSDGTKASASVKGTDASYDLAVLKVDRTGLQALPLGDSEHLRVGQPVVAVGSPLGLEGSVTSGIVSAVNRPVVTGDDDDSSNSSDTSYLNAVQTDAAINHGNSGGPLLDMDGKVIGVNTAIASSGSSGGNIGVGFAIPADQVQRTTEQLISTGHATHPVIGVDIDLDASGVGDGVRVKSVTKDSPADRAGIKEGDVIEQMDGVPMRDPSTFIVGLRSKSVGQPVTLVITSQGSKRTLTVTPVASSGS